jgi:hypothetical protein
MFVRRQMLQRVAARALPRGGHQGYCCGRRAALVSSLRAPGRSSTLQWQPVRLLSAAPTPEPELDSKGGGNTQQMPGGSSSSPSTQKIRVERKLMPAGIISRGFAVLLDGVLAGGASAVVCELALANGYADSLGVFVASFGALMLVRDQLPGQFASVGKERLGLELVGSDPLTNGEKYGRCATVQSCCPRIQWFTPSPCLVQAVGAGADPATDSWPCRCPCEPVNATGAECALVTSHSARHE